MAAPLKPVYFLYSYMGTFGEMGLQPLVKFKAALTVNPKVLGTIRAYAGPLDSSRLYIGASWNPLQPECTSTNPNPLFRRVPINSI